MIKKIQNLLLAGRKQTVILITVIFILINSFGVILYFKNKGIDDTKNWVVHSYQVLAHTRNLLLNLQDLEINQREYLLLKQNSFLNNYDKEVDSLREQCDHIIDIVSDNPSQTRKAKVMKANVLIQEQSLGDQVTTLKTGAIISTADIAERAKLLANTRAAIDDFINDENKLLNERTERENNQTDNFIDTILFGTVFALIALFGANGLIIYYSTRNSKVEADLKKSQEIYTTVTQGINEGVFELNIPEKTVFFSPSFKKMLGYKDNEFPNTREAFSENIHPDDFVPTMELAKKYYNHEIDNYRNYFRMRHRDGYYIWIMSRGIGLWDEKGNIQKLVGTHTDITEQKETEEYLKRLNAEIENFTYITSHDLRSPLVNLKGFSSELQYNVDELADIIKQVQAHLEPDKQKAVDVIFGKEMPEALNYIKSSIDRLDQLTSAILDLSKIGRREIRVEPVNIQNMVKKMLDSLAFEIQNKNTKVELGNLAEINTDAVSISQIFSNVIENALKYLDPERPGVIKITGKINPGEVEFAVADNGRGISEMDKPRIFEMFKRARNVEGIRGVGMGMSYVKATVQRLGGRIWFESELDVGTKFIFTIPNRASKGA